MSSAVAKHIFTFLCKNEGCSDYGKVEKSLRQSFTVADEVLSTVLYGQEKFAIIEDEDSNTNKSVLGLIIAKTSLRVCKNYKCVGCEELHLCRYLVCGNCRFGTKCKKSHDLGSAYNLPLLKKHDLQGFTSGELFQLLLQNDHSLLPEVCFHYNKGSGEHGSCKYETACTSLHLCQHFLQEDCKFGASCKRAHAFDANAEKILNGRGIGPENKRNLQKIYRNRLLITSSKDKPVKKRELADKCVRVHHHLPYKWQILQADGVTWSDLPNEDEVEKEFCNPARNDNTNLVTSETLEKIYLSDNDKEVPFDSDMHQYILTFKDMFQRNLKFKTVREIRRRPRFVSAQDAKGKTKGQKEQMTGRNEGKEVAQRQLFHGTNEDLIEPICQQNFDWRVCGSHGTLYGKGSYFARDASYSDTYIQSKTSKKKMFLVQVLVGEFTRGQSSLVRPPAKNSKSFYDSCVDGETNPAIFVVFEKYQVYPEFIIEYS
ncbi:Poly [ADP-ribose] polymerase 12 [Triplophysa tibetana]|uniref:Poly [ADP-ribose] polymerase 12 n=1 Tax=Triplophysa tibetana TaxID=1572043 RepID=A0A5A9NZ96_9TELE|nr:Poly [ADP-ribose] polymerase 12 [Triplophysa tibetana]